MLRMPMLSAYPSPLKSVSSIISKKLALYAVGVVEQTDARLNIEVGDYGEIVDAAHVEPGSVFEEIEAGVADGNVAGACDVQSGADAEVRGIVGIVGQNVLRLGGRGNEGSAEDKQR